MWATKQHDAQQRSYVRIADAREESAPAEVLTVRTTASVEKAAFKDEIEPPCTNQAHRCSPKGVPVRLELSFVIGNRTWLPVWKPTIDALDPLLGRTDPENPYHPLDGRIVELGMHLEVDPTLGYDVVIGSRRATAAATIEAKQVFGQQVSCRDAPRLSGSSSHITSTARTISSAWQRSIIPETSPINWGSATPPPTPGPMTPSPPSTANGPPRSHVTPYGSGHRP